MYFVRSCPARCFNGLLAGTAAGFGPATAWLSDISALSGGDESSVVSTGVDVWLAMAKGTTSIIQTRAAGEQGISKTQQGSGSTGMVLIFSHLPTKSGGGWCKLVCSSSTGMTYAPPLQNQDNRHGWITGHGNCNKGCLNGGGCIITLVYLRNSYKLIWKVIKVVCRRGKGGRVA